MFGEELWSHPYVETAGYFSVTVLFLVVAMAVFELITKYENWEEIKQGNVAAAIATGGKIFGVANIFRFSIERHNTLFEMMSWAIFGFLLLLLAYWLFEWFTPMFHVDEEIEKDNRAVGVIACSISVGLSFVIGASILNS